jgi:hypothetical protein
LKIFDISCTEIVLTIVTKLGKTTLNLLGGINLRKYATNTPLKADANLHIDLKKLETIDKLNLAKITRVQIP